MFRWYQESTICYVYLHNLDTAKGAEADMPQCIWFTRGWTLQELIAPRRVHFYDASWNKIGSRRSLSAQVSRITGIDEEVLSRPVNEPLELSELSVAQRMSWASSRRTEKPEDIAYCLLGIFEVNMPPLYGEGWNSFLRLQEVILERTQDLSVFAWKPLDKIQTCRGALARSPAEFAWCKSIFTLNFSSEADDFALTGSGLRITTQILEDRQLGKKQVNDLPHSHLILGLNCATLSASDGSLPGGKIGIILRKVGERLFLRDLTSSGGIRLDNKLDWGKSKDEWLPQQNINIPRDVSAPQSLRYNKTRAFGVFFHIAGGLKVVQAMPPLRWDPSLRAFIPGTMHATRALVIRPNKVNDDADDFVVIITEMGIMGKLFSLARSEVPEVPNAACMLNSIYVILRRHPNAKIILENISNLHEGDIQHYLQHRALKMEPTRPGQAGPAVSLPWPALEAQRKGTVELPCGVINLARGRCDIQALMLGDEIGVDCIAILPLEANEQGEGNEQGEKDQTQDLNSSAFSGSGLNEDRHHETENIWKNLGHCPNTDRPDPSTAAPTLYQMILVANADNLLTTWASSTSCTARLMTLLLVTNSRP